MVIHKTYGEGEVIGYTRKEVRVDFGWRGVKNLAVTVFDMGLATTEDNAVIKKLNSFRKARAKENPRIAKVCGATYGRDSFFDGDRAEDIGSCSPEEFYKALGYIAANAKYIEAEVSQCKVELFEEMFGTSVCYIHNDADNNRNQFRIDFRRTENIPRVLEECLLDVNEGRVARSAFVERLVKEYGFTFGPEQNLEKIRTIVESRGYLKDFEAGYAL